MNTAINQVLAAALGDQLEVVLFLDLFESLHVKDDFVTVGEIVLGQHEHYRLVKLLAADFSDPRFNTIV